LKREFDIKLFSNRIQNLGEKQMRNLTLNDIHAVSGGNFQDGYTMDYVVTNTLIGAVVGGVVGVSVARVFNQITIIGKCALAGAVLCGTYALAKMAASELDNYLFSDREK